MPFLLETIRNSAASHLDSGILERSKTVSDGDGELLAALGDVALIDAGAMSFALEARRLANDAAMSGKSDHSPKRAPQAIRGLCVSSVKMGF